MDLIEGAAVLTVLLIFILGVYLWSRGKPFRDAKNAGKAKPSMKDGMPSSMRGRR